MSTAYSNASFKIKSSENFDSRMKSRFTIQFVGQIFTQNKTAPRLHFFSRYYQR